MKNFLAHFKGGLGNSFRSIYGVRDEQGRGRFCMLLSTVMASIISQLSGGLFYTSFLLMYGMDKSRIGILTFIPYMTCLFSIFSPYILERFKKRKRILVVGKFVYYFINIVGITLLPIIVQDPDARLFWFVVLVFAANAVNQFFLPGFTAWNSNFLPERVRVDYFASSLCIQASVSGVIVLAVSYVGDMFAGTAQENQILIAIRYIAFALAVVDCIIWLIPKEYPYAKTARVKLSNVFVLPIRNKRFFRTVLIVAICELVYQLPYVTLNAYILQDVGVSYTLVNGINSTYFVFYIIFAGMWKKFIKRNYWFRATTFGLLLESFTYLAYAFVTADTIWLYILVRLSQHFTGVVRSICAQSLPYVNLPEEDRTSYLSFNTILTNFSIFLGMMLGTVFTGFMGERVLTIFHYPFSSTQILLLCSAVGECIAGLMAFAWAKSLTPSEVQERLFLKK